MARKWKFKDMPQEMIEVLQQRCGSNWDPKALEKFMEVSQSGFPGNQMYFTNTPEGSDFWDRIFNTGDLEHFYTKYSKNTKAFTEKPKGARKGDKFIVVTARDSIKVGDILTLAFNDRSDMPRFSHPNGNELWYEWVNLAPYSGSTKVSEQKDSYKKGFTEIPTGYNPGDKFKVVNTKCFNGDDLNYYYEPKGLKIGDIIELTRRGEDEYPFFKYPSGYEYQACWGSLELYSNDSKQTKLQPFPDQARPDEKVGTKYIVIDPASKADAGLKKGDTVTLQKNDGTSCPYFDLPDHCTGERKGRVISWKRLAPHADSSQVSLNCPYKVGDIVEIINVLRSNGHSWNSPECIGKTMVLTEKDIKCLLEKEFMMPEGNKHSINFIPSMLKIVGNTNSNSQTLNSNKLEHGKVQQNSSSNGIVLPSVPPTIAFGSVVRGVELRSNRETCKLGS